MLYSAARFFLEYLRGDYTDLIWGLFKSAQMTSLFAFTISLIVFVYLSWQQAHSQVRNDKQPGKKNKK